jgi:hypothetical protein
VNVQNQQHGKLITQTLIIFTIARQNNQGEGRLSLAGTARRVKSTAKTVRIMMMLLIVLSGVTVSEEAREQWESGRMIDIHLLPRCRNTPVATVRLSMGRFVKAVPDGVRLVFPMDSVKRY